MYDNAKPNKRKKKYKFNYVNVQKKPKQKGKRRRLRRRERDTDRQTLLREQSRPWAHYELIVRYSYQNPNSI